MIAFFYALKRKNMDGKIIINTKNVILYLLITMHMFLGFEVYAADLCIPKANGVPGTLLWQKPPNWYDPTQIYPIYDTSIDAPGWRGAVSNTYPSNGSGTTEHVKFRALHRDEGGAEYLYLSWHIKLAPVVNFPGDNLVWVGFHNPSFESPNVDAVALKVEINQTDDQTAAEQGDSPNKVYITAIKTKSGGNWTDGSVPFWFAEDTRVWITRPDENSSSWAIHMRIPKSEVTGIIGDIDSTEEDYDFGMWYEVRVKTSESPPQYAPYVWPRNIGAMVSDDPPNTDGWSTVRLTDGTPESPDPTCPTEGVSLLAEDIGTTNADPHAINIISSNTFQARPTNNSGGDVNLKARFRTANWGVQAIWENNSTNTLWEDLGPVTGHPATGVTINSGVQRTIDFTYDISGVTKLCDRCEYKNYYDNTANTANCDDNCPPAANGTKRDHQCLLVELIDSGGGVNFINDSAYRNMNFVNASEYSEIAEVNTIGLGPSDNGTMARDVYLYVQTHNMPQEVLPDDNIKLSSIAQPQVAIERVTKSDDISTAKLAPPVIENMDFESLSDTMPTYQVHAYYDTGLRNTAGGHEEMILKPMTSFGYFVMHEGALVGWDHGIEGAELTQLSPNYYKLAVGDDGIATVKTRIKAKERAYAVNFKLGINYPHNNFNSVVDSGLSLNLGFEYFTSPSLTFEAVFGIHGFDDSGLGSDLDINQISINARYYLRPNNIRPYINAGIGRYRLDPGDTEFGKSVGIGFLYNLTDHWALDAAYNYHDVNARNLDPQFSILQLGLRYLF